MYPFGSGMQQRSQPPTNNNAKQPAPFGSGWVQQPQSNAPYPTSGGSPYPASGSPYPPSGNPYPPSGSPYPPSGNPYPATGTPYPATGAPYPAAGASYPASGAPYPTSQNPYPSSTSYPSQAPYPSQNQPINPSYPPQISSQYPQTQQGAYPASPYPPQGQVSHSSYPSSSPYPPTQTHYASQQSSPYPSHQSPSSANNFQGQKYPQSGNMAQNNINKGRPTVVHNPNFDPNADAHALRKAMKGFGTDEDALINIICRRTNDQRQEIQRQYKTHFGKDLIEDIKSETSGNFEKLLVGLLRPIVDFYCTELCDAMAGIGTDEDVLVEILCTLSNSEIHTIKNAYLRMYGAHLESELKSETSGNFKRLLVSLCCAARDESGRVDHAQAQHDARELLNAGELRVGTDESMFNMVLCQRNYQQLKLTLDEYANITGHPLEKAIKREFSGDIQEGLLAICKCVTNKAEYFASRLHKSMAGIGTNDKQLIRVIITRSEIDLQDIKDTFEKMYGKSLKSWIKGDTSGHYKHALYALINEERSS